MKYRHLLIIIIIPFFLNGCHKDYQFQNFDYKTFNRVIGPKGGKINFYDNYGNDTKNDVIVTMDIPDKALDSLMVFNMYQFEDFEVTTQMEEGFAKFGSKLLYFVPFYESEGYHERAQLELNYHLSIKFKQPVTVTYYPLVSYSDLTLKNWQEVELYNNYYKTTNKSYKVYRIKIPKTDEWGENNNIYVNWNRQGYPNGYDRTDLSYIINGRWSAGSEWGTGDISMDNWELVGDYTLNTTTNTVKFTIFDTDYLYVVARDIYLPFIPPAILGFVSANFQTLQIKRASFDEKDYKVFLSDNSVAVFDRYLGFEYRINDNLYYSDLPTVAQAYIKRFYSSDVIKKVSFKQEGTVSDYDVLFASGIKLTFNVTGYLIGKFQFGINPINLPVLAQTYMKTNHAGELITNVTYDSLNPTRDTSNLYSAKYIVYTSSNVKVKFFSNGSWFESVFNKLDAEKLPPTILTYFETNYPNIVFTDINFTKGLETSFYNVYTVDKKWFYFGGAGKLWEYEFHDLSENDLPAPVKAYLSANFTNTKVSITNIHHIYNINMMNQEWYEIYFSDITDIQLTPLGIRIQQ
jgi:hypothetical protein